MSISRRDLFKVAGVAGASAVVAGCSSHSSAEAVNAALTPRAKMMPASKGKRVVNIWEKQIAL